MQSSQVKPFKASIGDNFSMNQNVDNRRYGMADADLILEEEDIDNFQAAKDYRSSLRQGIDSIDSLYNPLPSNNQSGSIAISP